MQRINEDIKNGEFQNIYLLYGQERYLRRYYRDKLKEALCGQDEGMNTHFFDGKDCRVGEIIDLAETLPFLASRRVIFMTDTGLFKSGGEQLAEYLAEVPRTTFFIFSESEVDKRSRLFKQVQSKGCAVCMETQDDKTLKRWIGGILKKEGKKITESTAALFLAKAGAEMENIQTELEKLICYCGDREVIEEADVEAICTERITNRIFDMINAMAERQQGRALELYYDLLALREPPMRILFLIARQCNMLLQTKEMKNKGHDNKTIGSRLGLAPFIVSRYVAQAGRFRTADLRRAVESCVEAEEAVKTGRMNDVMSVEILLLSVLSPAVTGGDAG